MPRVVKPAADRQDEILDVAQALFLQLGYENTPIQAVIDRVGIAKGTFYHHYPSKTALMDALIARITRQAMAVLEPVLTVDLGAVDKLNSLFQTVGAWKAERRDLMMEMQKVLRSDANIALRLKMEKEATAALVPYVARVIRQGMDEGVFHCRHPESAARYVLEMSITMGHRIADSLTGDELPELATVVTEIEAYHEAAERVLGAPPGVVQVVDVRLVEQWLDAQRRAG